MSQDSNCVPALRVGGKAHPKRSSARRISTSTGSVGQPRRALIRSSVQENERSAHVGRSVEPPLGHPIGGDSTLQRIRGISGEMKRVIAHNVPSAFAERSGYNDRHDSGMSRSRNCPVSLVADGRNCPPITSADRSFQEGCRGPARQRSAPGHHRRGLGLRSVTSLVSSRVLSISRRLASFSRNPRATRTSIVTPGSAIHQARGADFDNRPRDEADRAYIGGGSLSNSTLNASRCWRMAKM